MLFEDEEDQKPKIHVERMRRGEGTFVIVRFRNRNDLVKFADILDQPHLKTLKKDSYEKIVWHADAEKRGTLDTFFGE